MGLTWLQSALADLESVGNYIRATSPAAAQRFTARIVGAANHLTDRPSLGRPGRVIGTREMVVSGTPYIIAYRVRGSSVEVLGVMHSARRWPETFD